ncbi:MAG TPA: hydrogenase expression protein HupH [Caldilineae bacterium]|nr:hydrogenase expression protein HupH [Caldilineae bacterium]
MKRIKVIVAVSTDRWNRPLAEQYEQLKNPDTELTIVNLKKGPESIEAFYDEAFAEPFVVREIEQAADEGFDGIIIYCFGNPGLYAAREAVSIPVVGIGEAAINLACILGHHFSVVTEVAHAVPRVWRTIRLMGVTEKVASVRSADIPVLDMGDLDRLRAAVLHACETAIEADGADVLVLGCGSMFGVREEIEGRYGVPVVEPGPAALKLLESLLSLKLSHSKRAFRPPPVKQILF